jgi:hypothetical protein
MTAKRALAERRVQQVQQEQPVLPAQVVLQSYLVKERQQTVLEM